VIVRGILGWAMPTLVLGSALLWIFDPSQVVDMLRTWPITVGSFVLGGIVWATCMWHWSGWRRESIMSNDFEEGMPSNNALERQRISGGRSVLALDCVLAGAGVVPWPTAQQDR
jgi:hypothetical protein